MTPPRTRDRPQDHGCAHGGCGRLGEWMPVGAANDAGQAEQSGLLARDTRRARTGYSVWIKVEEVP